MGSLAARISSALQRLMALQRRRPMIADAALVAGLLLLGLGPRISDAPDLPASQAFTVALALPLLLRRRTPVVVFAAVATIAFAGVGEDRVWRRKSSE